MSLLLTDTIVALASAPGSGGRGILRCSGPRSRELLTASFTPDDLPGWEACRRPARFTGQWLWHSASVPVAVWLWPTSRSYTGQPGWEMHLPGAPPLLEGVLAQVLAQGARLATPGEFTLRAFLAGRIDLLQAEGVLGVIEAQSSEDLVAALQQLAGRLSGQLLQVRSDLLDLLADLEAELDFTEEGLEFVPRAVLRERIAHALQVITELAQATERDWQHRPVPRVVLAGLPNAGKSTLFNALTESGQALVSPIAGTTRDYLRAEVTWGETRLELHDTAGWEDAATGPLRVGMELGQELLEQVELVLWCQSPLAVAGPDPRWEHCRPEQKLLVQTMQDLNPEPVVTAGLTESMPVSAKTGEGLSELRTVIVQRLQQQAGSATSLLAISAARCRESLRLGAEALVRAQLLAQGQSGDLELLASDLREALGEIGQVTGAVHTDDLLDRIFSRFCIGK